MVLCIVSVKIELGYEKKKERENQTGTLSQAGDFFFPELSNPW